MNKSVLQDIPIQEAYKNMSIESMPGEEWFLYCPQILYKILEKSGDELWISSYGRIKQKRKNKTTILAQKFNKEKQLYFCFYNFILITARQMVLAWHHNPYECNDFTHVNGVKHDNRKENVQWAERNSDEILQPYINGEYKKIPVISKGTAVVKLDGKWGGRLDIYMTIKDAASANRIMAHKISGACISNEYCGGYKWMWLQEYLTKNKLFLEQAAFITNTDKHLWLQKS